MIGGGDTGADCVGNALREGARSVVQLELVPEPPPQRPDELTPWPRWPMKLRLSYAMKEAQDAARGELDFSIVTTQLHAARGRVDAMHVAQAAPEPPFAPVPGTEQRAAGRPRAARDGLPAPRARRCSSSSASSSTRAATCRRPAYATSREGVFVAGDARRGQSLIVWAINEGRQCAAAVERHLAALVS